MHNVNAEGTADRSAAGETPAARRLLFAAAPWGAAAAVQT